MPYGITQCYLPPGRCDIPAFITAEAVTRLSDPGGMQGRVDLVGQDHLQPAGLPIHLTPLLLRLRFGFC